MAACSDSEEKPSSHKDPLPVKILVESTATNNLRNKSNHDSKPINEINANSLEVSNQNGDEVLDMSVNDFQQLLIEATTFNKPSGTESDLLTRLRSTYDTRTIDTESEQSSQKNDQRTLRSPKCSSGGKTFLSSSASHSRTPENPRKHSRNKDSSKYSLNANQLQKRIHQSQSLQDLINSDLSKTNQRAHRTHSLSSDEVIGIDSNSILVPKSVKKSSGNSSNTKGAVTKRNSVADGSKLPRNSGTVTVTLNLDQVHTNGHIEDFPNQVSLSGDISIFEEQDFDRGSGGNTPIEIEMEEIKSSKVSGKDSVSNKEIEKTKNGANQSNSKFYVDCNDIDATVTFPLKLVSSFDDEALNEHLKKFPLVPWPRPLQVQSLINALPVESDSYGSRNKHLLATDINGNPFHTNARQNSFSSLVPSSYPDSENKNRKNKRRKEAVNQGVLAKNIPGHRGEEDIDSLLQFINSADKKTKSASKSNQGQMTSSKSSLFPDSEKRKSFGKEVKNVQKSGNGSAKKKLTRSNSLEDIKSDSILRLESAVSTPDILSKDSVQSDPDSPPHDLDVTCDRKEKHLAVPDQAKVKDNSADDSSAAASAGQSSPEVSSFAADFYSTANFSQTNEESGFLTVKKKQRKKHQGKHTDSLRWSNSKSHRKKASMLPLAESKCGKQDSRRKSTSSVPHSEHSSADNSDLDSVHSLPVRGSVPHPTQPHPHTTPSSSSSTPQASYADIARMTKTKLNTSPNGSGAAQTIVKSPVQEHDAKKVDTAGGAVSAKRRVSDSKEPSKASPHVTSIDDKSIGTSEVKTSLVVTTRERNTQTEPECPQTLNISKLDVASKGAKKLDSPKSSCSVCSSQRCSCSPSPHLSISPSGKNIDIPPVIMDKVSPDATTFDVSFGFGVDKILQKVSPEKEVSKASDLVRKDSSPHSAVKMMQEVSETVVKQGETGVAQMESVDHPVSPVAGASSKSPKESPPKASSPLKKVSYGRGKTLYYRETKGDDRFNHAALARYLANEMAKVQKELEDNEDNPSGSKVRYYRPEEDE